MLAKKKEVQQLTKKQVNDKIDSIYNARIQELDKAAQIDLDRRIKIEVKVKADSIFRAKMVLQK